MFPGWVRGLEEGVRRTGCLGILCHDGFMNDASSWTTALLPSPTGPSFRQVQNGEMRGLKHDKYYEKVG